MIRSGFARPIPASRDEWAQTASMDREPFCLELGLRGVLPRTEALQAARGEWPATFQDFVDGLPEDVQFSLKMSWATALTVSRSHPMIDPLGAEADDPLSPEDIDIMFGWDE